MLLFGNQLRSYRDLPLRYAESSTLHRNEPTGTLHGLLRVRHVTQDDAHIFCTREQIEDEIFGCLDYAAYLYDLFGMEARFELSTRPDNKLGTEDEWDFTEAALRAALDKRGLVYDVGEGEGAFYGPKIDLHMKDVLGRAWQMGTIQLDAQMPKQFGLTYMGADNHEHTPYVVHRALLGSLERFTGILIEHYAGAFPVWLAPVQVRVLPVAETHRGAVDELLGALRLAGVRVDGDERDETLGKRIRDAELQKIPYVVVWGDRETREAMAVRRSAGERASRRCRSTRSSTRSGPRAPPASGSRRSRIPPANGADGCYAAPLQAGAASPLTSPATGRARFNRVGTDEGMPPLHAVVFPRDEEDRLGLVNCL